MEERKLTEKESLEVITSMIARTKERYIGEGRIMLMWGYLVTLVAIAVWVMLVASRGQNSWNYLWFAIPVIGGIATPIMARREQRKKGVKTFSDKITSRLWTIAGLSEFLAMIVCVCIQFSTGISCWSAMLAYTLIAMPVTEIAQGLFIDEKSLTAGGIIGLAVGIVTVCCIAAPIPLGVDWFMPMFIIAFAAMMIIPGHILNRKATKE